jgi:hypothetical protein
MRLDCWRGREMVPTLDAEVRNWQDLIDFEQKHSLDATASYPDVSLVNISNVAGDLV